MCTVSYRAGQIRHCCPRSFLQCISPVFMTKRTLDYDLETDSLSRHGSLQGNDNPDPHHILISQLRSVNREDFKKISLDMDNSLKKSDVRNMVFLCKDMISSGISESFQYGRQVFEELMTCRLLSYDNTLILAKLLHLIRRIDLLKLVVLDINTWRAAVRQVGTIFDPYRVCLLELSENLEKQDIKKLLFLLTDERLPKSAMSLINDGIGLFSLMEENGLLSRNDYTRLQTMLVQAKLFDSLDIMDKRLGAGSGQISGQPANHTAAPSQLAHHTAVPLQPANHTAFQPDQLLSSNHQLASIPPAYTLNLCTDDLPSYKMNARPRGWCVIINNKEFAPDTMTNTPLNPREGSDIDCNNLENLFKELRFNVTVYENLTSRQMVQVMLQYSVKTDHYMMDCFVCCVLSHGKSGQLYGVDGKLLELNDLTNNFKGLMCPTLAGKPKLFFIQACQGRDRQKGVLCTNRIPTQEGPTDLESDDTGQFQLPDVPNEADFLMFFATVPGYVSYRSRSQGSWFVNSMVNNIRQYKDRYDLMTIMSNINAEVAQQSAPIDGGLYKQIPMYHATLRKRIFFSEF